jgi:hypothetical protein
LVAALAATNSFLGVLFASLSSALIESIPIGGAASSGPADEQFQGVKKRWHDGECRPRISTGIDTRTKR